jgi:hypothetical protein
MDRIGRRMEDRIGTTFNDKNNLESQDRHPSRLRMRAYGNRMSGSDMIEVMWERSRLNEELERYEFRISIINYQSA